MTKKLYTERREKNRMKKENVHSNVLKEFVGVSILGVWVLT